MYDKDSFGYKLGYGFGVLCLCCVMALVIAATVKLVSLLIF